MTSHTPSHSKTTPTMVSRLWAGAAILGVLLVLVLVGIRLVQKDNNPVALGQAPRDFTLTTFSGDVINTTELRGKVVLINFWASWCSTCDQEALLLQEAWQNYKSDESDEIVFLGIAYMDTQPASLDFLSTYGVTFPNGQDLRGEISKVYQVKSVPETFILDQEGKLQYFKIGPFSSLSEITAAIDSVLRQSQP